MVAGALPRLLTGCESHLLSPYNLRRAGCICHHGNNPRCEYPIHMADGSWQAPPIPAPDHIPREREVIHARSQDTPSGPRPSGRTPA
jgi:hypothetical protein